MPRKGENIYKRKDGRWEGRYIKERINDKAKYGYVFAHSYKEVKERLSKAKSNEITKSVSIVTSSNLAICSFSDIAQKWIELNRSQWKSSSLAKYINILNNYLLPRFGQCNMLGISREAVASYISELLVKGGHCGTGLAPKTVNSIISVMKNIFEYASVNKNLSLISFKGLNAKQNQKPMRILSTTEQNNLNEYLLNNPENTSLGILLSLYTGLRVGELCALKWEDVSFDDKCIHVHKTMQRIQNLNSSDAKTVVIISKLKSDCSIRDVPIPNRLFSIMQDYQKAPDTYILKGMKNLYVEPRTMQYRFKATTRKIISATVTLNILSFLLINFLPAGIFQKVLSSSNVLTVLLHTCSLLLASLSSVLLAVTGIL